MARFAGGDVVILPIPFSGGTGIKRRPALILAELPYYGGLDYLVCYITSRSTGDPYAFELLPADLIGGTLALKSYVRPLYMFAPAEHTILWKIGSLAPEKLKQIRQTIADVINP